MNTEADILGIELESGLFYTAQHAEMFPANSSLKNTNFVLILILYAC